MTKYYILAFVFSFLIKILINLDSEMSSKEYIYFLQITAEFT